MNGPKELAVRATLSERPAGLIERIELPPEKRSDAHGSVENTFAALFNGARQGYGHPERGPSFGKAEAEWGWPNAWYALRDAGLITITESIEEAPGAVGGKSLRVEWGVTDLGWQVRDDDLAYFRELMDARRADEADAIAIPDAELEPFAREAAVAWCNQTRRAVTDENMEYFMSRWRSLEPFRVDVAQIRART